MICVRVCWVEEESGRDAESHESPVERFTTVPERARRVANFEDVRLPLKRLWFLIVIVIVTIQLFFPAESQNSFNK